MPPRNIASQILALLLVTSTIAYAQGNSWNKVRYNGGTLQTKVSPKAWDNHLAVTSEEITFRLQDGQTVQIPTTSVTGLSYGQEAHRRVGTMIALGILVSPLALFGLFNKTRLHFIGVEYKMPDSKGAGLLLQGHKSNYRAILMALKSATGAPLAVAEADRKYVPTGIMSTLAPSPVQPEVAAQVGFTRVSSDTRHSVTPAPTTPLQRETVSSGQVGSKTASDASPAVTARSNAADAPARQNDGAYFGATSTDSPRIRHNGVTLSTIELNGPAYQAGLQGGDVILTIDGSYIYTVEELSTELQKHAPETRIAIKYMRGATFYETYVILGSTARF